LIKGDKDVYFGIFFSGAREQELDSAKLVIQMCMLVCLCACEYTDLSVEERDMNSFQLIAQTLYSNLLCPICRRWLC